MKNLLFVFTFSALIFSCGSNQSQTIDASNPESEETQESNKSTIIDGFELFGEEFGMKDYQGVHQLAEKMKDADDKVDMQLKVNVKEVCSKKGCWMTVDMPDSTEMMVRFKDYGFFVPLDAGGKTCVMSGFAYHDTISVDDRRHYAEDAGKSEEEIAEITEPEVLVAFEATGVYFPAEKE